MRPILIVDEDVWEAILERELIGAGLVDIARSTEEAEQALRSTDICILIIDPDYPDSRALVELAKSPGVGGGVIPVICISDWAPGGGGSVPESLCDHHFQHPFGADLTEVIELLLPQCEQVRRRSGSSQPDA